ncbi:MAG: DUF547 domain-containing protein [Cytophagaceae bacterium]
MLRKFLFTTFSVLILVQAIAGSNRSEKVFSTFDKFFKKFIRNGMVDYKKIKSHPAQMALLSEELAKADVSNFDLNQRKAFYINSYNFLVIKNIVENYPVSSPIEIDAFFTERKFSLAGELLSLEQIEKDKVLKQFSDIRMAFSLSSGIKGAPPLMAGAFLPGKLDKQLDQRMKLIVNDANYIRVKKNSNKLLLCEVFRSCLHCVREDKLVEYINQFREENVPLTYALDFYPTDRSLNVVSE